MRDPNFVHLSVLLSRHSAYTMSDHIECNCGLRTPSDEVRDPRSSHADHVAEKLLETFSIIHTGMFTPNTHDGPDDERLYT